MSFVIILLAIIGIYIFIKIYRAGRGNTIHKHSHCCDECCVREACDKYKKSNNIE